MLIRVDPASRVPLAQQIAAQVRAALVRGEVVAGQRLPTARALGGSLEVNLHTVLRAYSLLRDEGLIELRRGRGATVARGLEPEHNRLRQLAQDFVDEARRLGLETTEMTTMIERARP